MIGLAYWPLLLWLPLLSLQGLTSICMGRGAQTAVRGITTILVDTPLVSFLKIVWAVMAVLCLDCLRGVITAPSSTGAAGTAADARQFEVYASKEGALVLALNLASMAAVLVIHTLSGECMKLERDRDIMKRQAQSAGEFSKQLMEAEEKKAVKTVPAETKMPESKAAGDAKAEGDVRKRE
mmetsp:Transcript_83126/g.185722  ORF Transcript_83126/g.185722 Transcript_83126/m.185722 type:complete len:181 (+) Transcript_83126:3-545(+)